jgi:hypothetical protein
MGGKFSRGAALWVEADDKGLRFVLFRAYPFGQQLGRIRGGFAPGQDAPYGRVTDAKYGFGGAICGVHILLGAVGVGFFAERPYLDGEQRGFGDRACR